MKLVKDVTLGVRARQINLPCDADVGKDGQFKLKKGKNSSSQVSVSWRVKWARKKLHVHFVT